jgi:hypothetical protein
MSGVDLRPLSLGEILDRTFSLYRSNFLLFIGITGIPQLLSLAMTLVTTTLGPSRVAIPISPANPPSLGMITQPLGGAWLSLLVLIVSLIAYLFSQGGTVLAVSELYLGRTATITESFRRVWGDFGSLFGVVFLNGLAITMGLILLIIPGIYLLCRLLVCIPAALIENRGPRESLGRSFELTRGSAGRSFVIVILSVVLTYAAILLLSLPLGFLVASNFRDPSMLRLFGAMTQIASSIATILVSPVLLIATSVFYYDLRVRKEAFDLQFMMDPNPQRTPGTGDIPSILS